MLPLYNFTETVLVVMVVLHWNLDLILQHSVIQLFIVHIVLQFSDGSIMSSLRTRKHFVDLESWLYTYDQTL